MAEIPGMNRSRGPGRVCVAAKQNVAQAIDHNRYDVQIVHLGNEKNRLREAISGVKPVSALVITGQAYHINHGADLATLK